ncbi:MAG: hypothetical protein NTW86_17555 [Candidatus Sumerlaeota bacterium]|nr:hypothetical protein [Candidatus Sumerlaeota bacterium]
MTPLSRRSDSHPLDARAGFEGLVLQYQDRLLRFLLSRKTPADGAEDPCLEAFLTLWRNRERIRPGKEESFLFGIARRLLLAPRRRGAARPTARREELPPPAALSRENPDSLGAGAAAADSLPFYARPVFTAPAKAVRIEDMVHPLLADPVPNSLAVRDASVFVTGSNMSGKTTFIRSVAVERVAAAKAVLDALNRDRLRHLVFVSTHDTELAGLLRTDWLHVHFRESVEQGQVLFDYKLRPGLSSSRNALRLLQEAGYPAAVVADAQATAQKIRPPAPR